MRVSMRQAQLAHDQREPDDGECRDCAADVVALVAAAAAERSRD